MSLDAAASLSLKIQTKEALENLLALKAAYADLRGEITKPSPASSATKEAVQAAKTAQAELNALSQTTTSTFKKLNTTLDSGGNAIASYSLKWREGVVRVKEVLKDLDESKALSLAKSETVAAQEAAMWKKWEAEKVAAQKRATAQTMLIAETEKAESLKRAKEEAAMWAQWEKDKVAAQKRATAQTMLIAETERAAERKHEVERARELAKQVADRKAAADVIARSAALDARFRSGDSLSDAKRRLGMATTAASILGAGGMTEAEAMSRAIARVGPAAVVASGNLSSLRNEVDRLSESKSRLASRVSDVSSAQHRLNIINNEAHSLARGLSGSLGTLWITYGSLIPLLTGAAFGSSFVQAAKQGSEFAYQLTFVKALAGESTAEITKMGDAAKLMGQNSIAGAGEIASGFRILSQAGIEAKNSVLAMIPVLDLATVGEMTMEQAAMSLVGVMNAFKLPMSDLVHIGDVFAKAAALSQTSVHGMTEAMKYASVVGTQYGATMEDTATALTLLAKVNIYGTSAGTAFRNMLKEIYSPTKQAEGVFKDLKLSTSNANGEVRSFVDVIYDLRGKLEQFDKASQVKILQKMFGERGAKEAVAMLALTRDEWNKLNKEISSSSGFIRGVANELEATAKGTFAQAMNSLKVSVIDAFEKTEGPMKAIAVDLKLIFASEEFKSSVVQIVQLMTRFVGALTSAIPFITTAASAFAALSPVLVGVGAAMTTVIGWTAISNLTAWTLGLAAASTPLGLVAAGVGAFAGALLLLSPKTSAAITDIKNLNSALDTQIAKLQIVNAELLKKLNLTAGSASGDSSEARKRLAEAKAKLDDYQATIDDFEASGGSIASKMFGRYNPMTESGLANYKKYTEALNNIRALKTEVRKATLALAVAEGYEYENYKLASQARANDLVAQQELENKLKAGNKKWDGVNNGKGNKAIGEGANPIVARIKADLEADKDEITKAGLEIRKAQGMFVQDMSSYRQGVAGRIDALAEPLKGFQPQKNKDKLAAERAAIKPAVDMIEKYSKAHIEGKIANDFFEDSVREISEALRDEINVSSKTIDAVDALSESWTEGATNALAKYLESVRNVASSSEQLVTRAFQGMEDALVSFVKTGKLDFKSLADSIITDLIRMQVKASFTGPLAKTMQDKGLFGTIAGWFGGWGGGVPSHADYAANDWFASAKGNVFASDSLHRYVNTVQTTPKFFAFARGGVFAEAGPEAVMPLARDGQGRLGVRSQGSGTIVQIIEAPGQGGRQERFTPPGGGDGVRVFVDRIKSEMMNDVGRGGPFSKALESRYGLSTAGGSM